MNNQTKPDSAAPGDDMGVGLNFRERGWKFCAYDMLGTIVVTYPDGRELTLYKSEIGSVATARLLRDMAQALTSLPSSDSAAPGGDAREWLLKVMGEWDFSIPVGAFDAISSMLKSVTDEQYADAEALIAHLDELHDDGGQGGEKWEPAQAAIAGIKAWQAAKSAPGGDVEHES